MINVSVSYKPIWSIFDPWKYRLIINRNLGHKLFISNHLPNSKRTFLTEFVLLMVSNLPMKLFSSLLIDSIWFWYKKNIYAIKKFIKKSLYGPSRSRWKNLYSKNVYIVYLMFNIYPQNVWYLKKINVLREL